MLLSPKVESRRDAVKAFISVKLKFYYMHQRITSLVFLVLIFIQGHAQSEINYDESKVPEYCLPELLVTQKGKPIRTAEDWVKIRRPEILSLFEKHMYGKIPGTLELASWKVLEESQNAFKDRAIRKQVLLEFENNGKKLEVNLLIYLPNDNRKAPVFLGYNFFGNHTVTDDTAIFIPTGWSRNKEDFGIVDHQSTEKSRGAAAKRWPVKEIIDAGYGLATMYYGDVDPDKYGKAGIDFSDGVHPLLYKRNQTKPLPGEWGGISAWAWGLSRVMDYFEKDDDIDHKRIAVMGFSRLGKAALWAGAKDERFAIVISNNSGSGGAALSRRRYGERLEHMGFTHWFSWRLSKYHGNESALPVDQHMLIALMAPRPVYVASAEEDRWADPRGEFLSAFHASPVFDLFGKKGLSSSKMPEVNKPVMTTVGYHIRSGKHDITLYEWNQFISFSDLHLKQ